MDGVFFDVLERLPVLSLQESIKQHRKKNGWQRHLPPPLVGAQTHSNNVVATDNNNPATEALDASQTTTRCSSSNVADEDGPRPTNAATATTTTLSSSSSASSLASLGAPPPTPPPTTTTVVTLEVRVPLNDCASESTTTTTTTTTTSMSGTLWLPSHASKENKCHAFAICTPYGRRNLDTYGEVFGSRGYAMLIIEPRNRDRTNDDHFFDAESERRDMGRILMWIRSQEWHDKHICFLGGSMMGMQALAAAGAARQPHRYGNGLRGGKFAVVPVVSCNRLHTVMMPARGGYADAQMVALELLCKWSYLMFKLIAPGSTQSLPERPRCGSLVATNPFRSEGFWKPKAQA